MITAAMKSLLNAIGSKEAPKGYNQIYSRAEKIVGKPKLTDMTLTQIRALQNRMIKGGSASSAVGRYQFLRKTLDATRAEMKIAGTAVWTPDLQDRMAVHLMKGRGLNQYLAGDMSRTTFANNLAKEWASLPVVTPINGKRPGQSYYAGDGLNKAFHDPADILRLVDALKPSPQPLLSPEPSEPAPARETAVTAPAASGGAVTPSSPRHQIKTLQKALNDRNYDAGKEDGIWGTLTRAAVLACQGNNGLPLNAEAIMYPDVLAAPRWVVESRQEATVKDLRKDGSETIKTADVVQKVGGTAAGGAVVVKAGSDSGLFDTLGGWAEKAGTVKGWFEPFADIGVWIASNFWWGVALVGGAGAIGLGYWMKNKRLREYKEAVRK